MRQSFLTHQLFIVAGLALLTPLPIAPAHGQKPAATIRVATQPLTNYTPLLIAKEKGWFAEENLNVTWTMTV